MRLRSTGLGTIELKGKVASIEKKETGVYLIVAIHEPVVWKVRVFFQRRDIKKLPSLVLQPKIIMFLIKNLFSGNSAADQVQQKTG